MNSTKFGYEMATRARAEIYAVIRGGVHYASKKKQDVDERESLVETPYTWRSRHFVAHFAEDGGTRKEGGHGSTLPAAL